MYVDIHTHTHWSDKDITYLFNVRYGKDETPTLNNGLFSVGIHPWDAGVITPDESFISLTHKANAIGECGLDKRCGIPLNLQERVFTQQIELSIQLNKPLIIHCVGCYGRLLALSKSYSPHPLWIIHGCYTSPEWIASALNESILFSIGLREATRTKGQNMLKAIPLDRLLLETDEDTLSVKHVYKHLSLSPDKLPFVDQLISLLHNK